MGLPRSLPLVLCVLMPTALSAAELFELKPVADGVYAAVAQEQYKVNCNAAVILLDDSVMVVDTHSKPSAARNLIAQIRKVTDKPVKYVVIAHFHWDHFYGNEAYADAYPGVQFIASEATAADLERRGLPRIQHELVQMPKDIERLRGEIAKTTNSQQRAQLQGHLAQAESYLHELKHMRVITPTITFDRRLVLKGKTRTVELLCLGPAHTEGDTVVYLPKEKVLVTSDLLHRWTPYMGDSSPYQWIKVLEKLEQFDFDQIIGGHGDVIEGNDQIRLWIAYLTDLMAETAKAYSEGLTLAQARQRLSQLLVSKYNGRFPPTFAKDIHENINTAYRVVGVAKD